MKTSTRKQFNRRERRRWKIQKEKSGKEIECKVSITIEEEQDPEQENPFEFIQNLKETTPDPGDWLRGELGDLKSFIDTHLDPHSEPRWVTPKPLFTGRHLASAHNCLVVLAKGDNKNLYDIIFGFVLFHDPQCNFIRANSHIWLENRDTKEWYDPSPLIDENEKLGAQMLVRSKSLFTPGERETVLANPDIYNIGAIINHPLVPDKYQMLLQLERHYILIHASELRLEKIGMYSITNVTTDTKN